MTIIKSTLIVLEWQFVPNVYLFSHVRNPRIAARACHLPHSSVPFSLPQITTYDTMEIIYTGDKAYERLLCVFFR